MDDLTRLKFSEDAGSIEVYQRGLKQFTEVERLPGDSGAFATNHIGLVLRAFLLLEWHRVKKEISRFEAKMFSIRDDLRAYLSNPRYNLPKTATA